MNYVFKEQMPILKNYVIQESKKEVRKIVSPWKWQKKMGDVHIHCIAYHNKYQNTSIGNIDKIILCIWT